MSPTITLSFQNYTFPEINKYKQESSEANGSPKIESKEDSDKQLETVVTLDDEKMEVNLINDNQ